MPSISAELLAVVERSPEATAVHDRPAWVGLFTADGCVEDPFGSRPHVGHDQIGRFYDTFISPRQLIFHRDFDVVVGVTVVRDLMLEVVMAAGVTLDVSAHLGAVAQHLDLDPAGCGTDTQSRHHWHSGIPRRLAASRQVGEALCGGIPRRGRIR